MTSLNMAVVSGTPEQSTVSGVALFRLIMSQVGPNMLSYLSNFFTETVNVLFIGQHGTELELAAVGLGNMVQNCLGLSIIVGLATALDTLCSQAHGAGEDKLACTYVQRARVLATMQMFWILPMLCFSHVWLTGIGQDPAVAQLAGMYNGVTGPFMFLLIQEVAIEKLLSAMLRPTAACVINVVCSIGHVVWCAVLVGRMRPPILGLALANGITWSLRATLLIGYACANARSMGLRPSWVLGLQSEAFKGWRQFMRVAAPALVQLCGEWWYFEIMALLVGYLGATALAAHTATMNAYTLTIMIPISISASSTALVGNALGANNPGLARRLARSCVSLSVLAWAVLAGCIALGHSVIAKAYSQDVHVQRVMHTLLLILCTIGFPDSCQTTLGGVLRGLGKLQSASIIYLVSFYLVMLPSALLLAFPLGCGVEGVWWATGIGTFIAAVSFGIVVVKTDFGLVTSEVTSQMNAGRVLPDADPS